MPFGDGARACPGAKFALQETKLALFRMLQHFDLELTEPQVKVIMQCSSCQVLAQCNVCIPDHDIVMHNLNISQIIGSHLLSSAIPFYLQKSSSDRYAHNPCRDYVLPCLLTS